MIRTIKHSQSAMQLGKKAIATASLGCLLLAQVATAELARPRIRMDKPEPTVQVAQDTVKRVGPQSFAELAEQLVPTVVNIQVNKIQQVRDGRRPSFPHRSPFGDLPHPFSKDMPNGPQDYTQPGAGSGVIIDKEGYILTNHHVVERANDITVVLDNQREYEAEVVGRDPKTDLAVLKIKPETSLPVASLGDSDRLKIGAWVMAVGNPYGLTHTVTTGIVSAKGRVIGAGPYDNFIQTDASINPGNSGGPLFNMQGQLVGINTAILSQGRGIGFAIPVNMAKSLIPQLIHNGTVTRGYLGVNLQTITPELMKALQLETDQGTLVSSVTQDSPAAKSGIKPGDVIVNFNDQAVKSSRDLALMVAKTPVGTETEIVVLRNGQKNALALQVGAQHPQTGPKGETTQTSKAKWGMQLQNVTPEEAERLGLEDSHGVLVTAVQPGSPAAESGLRRGDVLVEVNRQAVTSIQDVKDAIAEAKETDSLLVLVKRDQGSLFVAMAQ